MEGTLALSTGLTTGKTTRKATPTMRITVRSATANESKLENVRQCLLSLFKRTDLINHDSSIEWQSLAPH